MNKIALLLSLMTVGFAHAEDKTCAVKGMHCQACQEMVQSKVCDTGKYTTCDVKIISEKKSLGQIHLITKDASSKVDEAAVGSAVKDAGYTLDKCNASAAKASKPKAG